MTNVAEAKLNPTLPLRLQFRSFTGNERRLKEFDTFFELASAEAANRGELPLGGDDSQRFIRLYEEMVLRGDREAAWRFHVFENNLVLYGVPFCRLSLHFKFYATPCTRVQCGYFVVFARRRRGVGGVC